MSFFLFFCYKGAAYRGIFLDTIAFWSNNNCSKTERNWYLLVVPIRGNYIFYFLFTCLNLYWGISKAFLYIIFFKKQQKIKYVADQFLGSVIPAWWFLVWHLLSGFIFPGWSSTTWLVRHLCISCLTFAASRFAVHLYPNNAICTGLLVYCKKNMELRICLYKRWLVSSL